MTAAMAIGDCGYGDKGELGEAFAAFAEKRLRWSPDPARVYAIPDVMTGVAELLRAATPEGSGVVINPPVYQPFFYRIRQAGRQVVEAPLRRGDDGRYDLDLDVLDRALATGGAAAYLLCSPHNPTGRVWSREQLTTAADLCARHGVLLVVDEIHAPLALSGAEHVPFFSLEHQQSQRARRSPPGAETAQCAGDQGNAARSGSTHPALACGEASVAAV